MQLPSLSLREIARLLEAMDGAITVTEDSILPIFHRLLEGRPGGVGGPPDSIPQDGAHEPALQT